MSNNPPTVIVPHYTGHRKRVRERYLKGGIRGWQDYEILELLLFHCIPRRDTKILAKEILKRHGSLRDVFALKARDLQAVKGMTANGALLFSLVKDIATRLSADGMRGRDLLSSPEAVVNYLKLSLQHLPDEEFHALFLDNSNRLIASEIIHAGTVNKSIVYPRTIVERALYNHAAGVIIAHNHPGASISPSKEDRTATTAVAAALATVEITLLDHILIAGNRHISWKEEGML